MNRRDSIHAAHLNKSKIINLTTWLWYYGPFFSLGRIFLAKVVGTLEIRRLQCRRSCMALDRPMEMVLRLNWRQPYLLSHYLIQWLCNSSIRELKLWYTLVTKIWTYGSVPSKIGKQLCISSSAGLLVVRLYSDYSPWYPEQFPPPGSFFNTSGNKVLPFCALI